MVHIDHVLNQILIPSFVNIVFNVIISQCITILFTLSNVNSDHFIVVMSSEVISSLSNESSISEEFGFHVLILKVIHTDCDMTQIDYEVYEVY